MDPQEIPEALLAKRAELAARLEDIERERQAVLGRPVAMDMAKRLSS